MKTIKQSRAEDKGRRQICCQISPESHAVVMSKNDGRTRWLGRYIENLVLAMAKKKARAIKL